MTINYNIWKIFILLLLFSSLFIGYLLFSNYNTINNRYHSQVRHYTEIISRTVNSEITQYDMLLSVIGNQLLADKHYKNGLETQLILDELLKQNQFLVGFGLADTSGNLLSASSNIKNIDKINFLKNKQTSETFQKALENEYVVLGRTYFFNSLNQWVIPLRKAIRDVNGTLLGVMTTGLKNKKTKNFLNTLKLAKYTNILIIKDIDNKNKVYRQYVNNPKNNSYESLYDKPVSNEMYIIIAKKIFKKYGFTLDYLRQSNETVSIEFHDTFNQDIIAGITYSKKYNLWILVENNDSEVWNEFIRAAAIDITLFLVVFILFFMLFQNIASFEKRKKSELIYQAQHDSLTNLPNRNYMYENVEQWIREHKNQFDVFYLDLDNFKNINDRFGHMIGDKILVEVASRLRAMFSSDDMLIRQGGDEFIVLKQCVDNTIKNDKIQMLLDAVSRPYIIENKEFRIGLSIGISSYPTDSSELQDLLSFADIAMYEAKKIKNSYCFFSKSMNENIELKAELEQELRGAIENSELWMVYQPQINADGSLHGVEALIRWQNKKLGLVGPDKFIAIAEEIGMMRELGAFILEKSLFEVYKLQNSMNEKFQLSINISVVQFMDTNFIYDTLKVIERVGMPKSLVTLEITESLSIEDLDVVVPVLHAIRDEGINVSLDDFGTGYSSLSLLKKLPINELKIDKSFVDDILYDTNANALVSSIINIGRNFTMKTLAEGVESLEQVEELKEFSCDIFQGYYFSKPLTIEDLEIYINNREKR